MRSNLCRIRLEESEGKCSTTELMFEVQYQSKLLIFPDSILILTMSGKMITKFSVMSSSNGWDNSSATPGHLCSYERQQLNWVVPIVINQDGYYAITALEVSSTVYKIMHGYPDGEYLLIENKQPLKWDSDIP